MRVNFLGNLKFKGEAFRRTKIGMTYKSCWSLGVAIITIEIKNEDVIDVRLLII